MSFDHRRALLLVRFTRPDKRPAEFNRLNFQPVEYIDEKDELAASSR